MPTRRTFQLGGAEGALASTGADGNADGVDIKEKLIGEGAGAVAAEAKTRGAAAGDTDRFSKPRLEIEADDEAAAGASGLMSSSILSMSA